MNKNNATKLDTGKDSNKYKLEAIFYSAVYIKKSELVHLLGLYILVFWKSYLKDKNIREFILAVLHFKKFINLFYKNYCNKPIAISKAINNVLSITKPTVKLTVLKQK